MTIETVEQVRSRNFQWLFQQFKDEVRRSWPDEPDRGMLKKFAQRLGKNPIYLSQLNNNRKPIGTATANDIEKALGLPDGWMDVDHSKEAVATDDDAKAFQDSVMAIYTQAPEATKTALLKVIGALVTGRPLEDLAAKH